MLRVLPPTFEPVLQQIRLQGLFSWVLKHAVPTDQQHGMAWLKHPNPNTLFSLPRRRSLGPLGFVSRSFFAKTNKQKKQKQKKQPLIWQMKVNFPGVASEFLGTAPTFGLKRTERFVVECLRPPNNLSRTRRPCTKKRAAT